MPNWLVEFFRAAVIKSPLITAFIVVSLVIGVGLHVTDFRMDASSDSLVLENDRSLEYYRKVKKKYGTDDYLFVTFAPRVELFSRQSIKQLQALKTQLSEIEDVETVISLVDAPLFDPENVSLSNIQDAIYFVRDESVDLRKAKEHILKIPLYVDLLVNEDASITALQINLKGNPNYFRLNDELRRLQWKELKGEPLSAYEKQAKINLKEELRLLADELAERNERVIGRIRNLMKVYSPVAEMHLGGIPMIAHDMIEYVRNDLVVFGAGVFLLLIAIQAFLFRRLRWIIITLGTCIVAAVTSMGMLGLLDWPVTVISSNFVALLLIITMSLVVHLIVRFRQLERERSDLDYDGLIIETLRSMFTPCLYTALTTIVAFGSLIVSDIRPVIDFGKMMVMSVAMAFVLAFVLFPLLMKCKAKQTHDKPRRSGLFSFPNKLAVIADKQRTLVIVSSLLLSLLSAAGIRYLSVDNRFIEYFKADTEIHQGMKLIDTQLGGTTPLEIIIERGAIEADFAFVESESEDEEWEDDPLFDDEDKEESPRLWLTSFGIEKLHRVQDYLESLPVTGKVLSLAAGLSVVEQINGGQRLDDFQLNLLQKKIPKDLREQVLAPFYDRESDEVRFLIRVRETHPDLNRNQLLEDITQFMTREMGISPDYFHITGMLILYNNMLESLFRSQILTLGVVFAIILGMFLLLFRNLKLALLGMIPNLVGACFVLGMMGWLGIPLDMMTITIAAISIGIAVDNTIHYIFRFKLEFAKRRDYKAAMYACHDTIARAMYFTSVTIIAGFSILVLSNFMPTIYFGVFTSIAMFVALLANLTLLPAFLLVLKPLSDKQLQADLLIHSDKGDRE